MVVTYLPYIPTKLRLGGKKRKSAALKQMLMENRQNTANKFSLR